jgi:hypothetical protein
VRAEAIVVEIEMAQGDMGGKEGDKRGLGVEAKGVVVEVDSVQVGQVKD